MSPKELILIRDTRVKKKEAQVLFSLGKSGATSCYRRKVPEATNHLLTHRLSLPTVRQASRSPRGEVLRDPKMVGWWDGYIALVKCIDILEVERCRDVQSGNWPRPKLSRSVF